MQRCRSKSFTSDYITWTGENKNEVTAFCGDAIDTKDLSVGDKIVKGFSGSFMSYSPLSFEHSFEAFGEEIPFVDEVIEALEKVETEVKKGENVFEGILHKAQDLGNKALETLGLKGSAGSMVADNEPEHYSNT